MEDLKERQSQISPYDLSLTKQQESTEGRACNTDMPVVHEEASSVSNEKRKVSQQRMMTVKFVMRYVRRKCIFG